MKRQFRLLNRYIRYLLTSKSRHGIHSPFLFELIDRHLRNADPAPGMDDIEKIRRQLLRSKEIITKTDYGTGGGVTGEQGLISADVKPVQRYKARVSDIARGSISSPYKMRLIYRLVESQQPDHILEVGTSFGLSAACMAKASPGSHVVTIEGCPETSRIAIRNLEKLGIHNVTVLTGDFRDLLPEALNKLDSIDFLYADANHTEEATVTLFESCKNKARNDSLFVFDDIHWSEGMERAWHTIKADPSVKVSMDLFHLGLVFFRKESSPEHFVVRL
jgi:predicted O-methyltransferase YrrM